MGLPVRPSVCPLSVRRRGSDRSSRARSVLAAAPAHWAPGEAPAHWGAAGAAWGEGPCARGGGGGAGLGTATPATLAGPRPERMARGAHRPARHLWRGERRVTRGQRGTPGAPSTPPPSGPPTPLRAEKLAGESHAHPTPGKVRPLRAGRGTSGRISARGSCTRWSRLHPRAHAAEGTREPVCVLRAGEGVHPAAVGPWNGAALSTRAFPWRGHVRWCLRDEGAAARPQALQTGTPSS